MLKDEAWCRYWARQIWTTQFPAEAIQGDEARISFESLVAAGINEGVHAWIDGMSANQAGNIDQLLIAFSRRIV